MVTASIVICVYNRGPLAVQCARSLLAMDCQDFEIVFVDDGSTDNTRATLEQFRQRAPQAAIQIVANPRNMGVSAARNTGIDAARGEFIFFTDSDCTVEPAWLSHMLEAFRDPRVASAAGCVIDAAPRNWAELAQAGSSRIGRRAWQCRMLVGNNMGFRADVLRRYRFDPAMSYYCDDDDLAWRLRSDGHRMELVSDAIVYHDHPYTLGKYLRKALRQGEGSARLWYKHGIYLGRDLWLPTAGILALLLGLVHVWSLFYGVGLLLLHMFALSFNEVVYKGKHVRWIFIILPVEMAYSALKAWSVGLTLLRIVLRTESIIRQSKQRWLRHSAVHPST